MCKMMLAAAFSAFLRRMAKYGAFRYFMPISQSKLAPICFSAANRSGDPLIQRVSGDRVKKCITPQGDENRFGRFDRFDFDVMLRNVLPRKGTRTQSLISLPLLLLVKKCITPQGDENSFP